MTAARPLADFEHECFFMAPIGDADSQIRRRSDGIMANVVAPAVAALGLNVVRADQIGSPGQITLQIIQHVLEAKVAVADLTGANANVFYELAVRHTARRPVALIASVEEQGKLPFDIAEMRTIFYDVERFAMFPDVASDLRRHVQAGMDGHVESPISASIDVRRLEGGSSLERTVAVLVTTVEELSREVRRQGDKTGPRETGGRNPAVIYRTLQRVRQGHKLTAREAAMLLKEYWDIEDPTPADVRNLEHFLEERSDTKDPPEGEDLPPTM